MMRPLYLALVLWPVCLAACSIDLSVDPHARLTCTDNGDCPAGYQCKTSLGRCFEIGADDVLPTVTNATVMPPKISPGVPATVRLDVSEPLAAPPRVFLGSPERQAATLAGQPDALSYELTLTVAADDTPGAWPVLADLVDASGNAAASVAAGTLILDFEDPEVIVASVEYVPDAGNVLQRVGALRDGGTARVVFSVSEPLGSLALRAVCGADTLTIPTAAPAAGQMLFAASLQLTSAAVAADGECDVVADLADDAQNAVTAAPVATVLIDRTPPRASDVRDAELMHLRVPWGAAQTGGAAAQFLTRADIASTDDPEAMAIPRTSFEGAGETLWEVRVFDDAAGQRQLGTLLPDPSGWPSLQLSLVDSRRVYVELVDQAGNTSGIVPLSNGRWIASMNGKVQGETYDNPHVAGSYPSAVEMATSDLQLRTPLLADAAVEAGAPPGSTAVGYAGLTTSSAVRWIHGPRRTRQPQEQSVGAYDSARDRVVILGGGQMWIYQRQGWDRLYVSLPPDRVDAAMAYDPQRDRVVLFGGEYVDASGDRTGIRLGDTWEWDGNAWREQSPITAPDPRARHGMVYDARIGRAVMLGGEGATNCDGGGSTGCTGAWQWDGQDWALLAGASPGARLFPAMTFDSDQMRLVVHGGLDPAVTGCDLVWDPCACDPASVLTDTWRFDAAGWSEIDAGGPQVSPAQLSYDSGRQRGVLLGCGEVAELDGDSWSSRCDGVPSTDTCTTPADPTLALVGQVQVYDPIRRRTFVYGGLDAGGEGNLDQGLEWDGSDWSANMSWWENDVPWQLAGASLVYDSLRERVVLFGGLTSMGICPGGSPDGYCQDTWEWDGSIWTYRTPVTKPDHDAYTAMAFDPVRKEAVLFTAASGATKTWAYDGTDWTDLGLDPLTMPPARSNAAMAWDPVGERLILFGGYRTDCSTGDTWEWTGSEWNDLQLVGGPTSRTGPGMATDLARGRIVMFGGTTACGSNPGAVGSETWEFDGEQWVEAATTGPGARYGNAMAYDAGRRRVVMFGGYTFDAGGCDGTGNRYCDTMWSWDGSAWTQLAMVDPNGDGNPPPSRFGAMAYDAAHAQLVLIAGEPGDLLDDAGGSWTSAGATTSPAQLARIDVGSAFVPLDALTELSVAWDAGAFSWRSADLVLHDGSGGTNLVRTYDAASPPVDALTQLDGQRLDGLWHLSVWDRVAGNSATINDWCVDANGAHGGPYCASPAAAIADRGAAWLTLDLRGETPATLSDVAVSVDITHPDTSELEVRLAVELPVSGAALYGWSRGRWARLDENTADTGSPVSLTWADTQSEPAAWLFGDVLNLAAVPAEPDPTALDSQIASGALEVTLDYTLAP